MERGLKRLHSRLQALTSYATPYMVHLGVFVYNYIIRTWITKDYPGFGVVDWGSYNSRATSLQGLAIDRYRHLKTHLAYHYAEACWEFPTMKIEKCER